MHSVEQGLYLGAIDIWAGSFFIVEKYLYIVRCLTASLPSIHSGSVASPRTDNPKCLKTLPSGRQIKPAEKQRHSKMGLTLMRGEVSETQTIRLDQPGWVRLCCCNTGLECSSDIAMFVSCSSCFVAVVAEALLHVISSLGPRERE